MKRSVAFMAVALLLLIALAIALSVMVMAGGPKNVAPPSNYTGHAKHNSESIDTTTGQDIPDYLCGKWNASRIVLRILNVTGHNPFNASLPPPTPNTYPYFNIRVLQSEDPAVQAGTDHGLVIIWNMGDGMGWMNGYTPEPLVPDAIVGINDYRLDGNNITVEFKGGPNDWAQKITLLTIP